MLCFHKVFLLFDAMKKFYRIPHKLNSPFSCLLLNGIEEHLKKYEI